MDDPTGIDMIADEVRGQGWPCWVRKNVKQTKLGRLRRYTHPILAPTGQWIDDTGHVVRIEKEEDIEIFLLANNFFDPILNPFGRFQSPDEEGFTPNLAFQAYLRGVSSRPPVCLTGRKLSKKWSGYGRFEGYVEHSDMQNNKYTVVFNEGGPAPKRRRLAFSTVLRLLC